MYLVLNSLLCFARKTLAKLRCAMQVCKNQLLHFKAATAIQDIVNIRM